MQYHNNTVLLLLCQDYHTSVPVGILQFLLRMLLMGSVETCCPKSAVNMEQQQRMRAQQTTLCYGEYQCLLECTDLFAQL
jgi:hypothetical protein